MEARVGVSGQGGVVDGGGARKYLQQQSMHQQTQMGTLPQLFAGGVAGAFAKTCTAPMARLTILFQVQGMHSEITALTRPSILHEALRIVNEEGVRAFWKGNMVTVVHRLPYSAVNFYAYERYKHIFRSIAGFDTQNGNKAKDALVHFTCGGMAGITAASASYPLDIVRTRLAAQRNAIYYRGIWHALSTICKDEGFFGLYKGLGATLLGVGPSLAISFTVYETLQSLWRSQRPDDSTVTVSLSCGGVSGIASSVATFPLDLVRRRMQLEGVAGRARVYNTGLAGAFRHIFRTEGLRGLYRGILPEIYKVVPGYGIVFMTYETLKKLLSEHPFNS